MKYINSPTKIFLSAVLLAAIAIPSVSYLYIKNSRSLPLNKTTGEVKSVSAQNFSKTSRSEDLIKAVNDLISLPTDEKPTIATITKVEQLRAQPLFKNAKNGDKLLIYAKNKKAVVYDPVHGKIVDVGPINVATSSSSPTPASF